MAPPSFSQAKINNITWKLHEARGRMHEDLMLRHAMIQASHHAQLSNDKASIMSHIHRLQPGARKAFLAYRLEQLNKML